MNQPNQFLRQAIREWCADNDMAPPVEGHNVKPFDGPTVAAAYEALPVNEYRAYVYYDALATEVRHQYHYARELGYTFEHTATDPYPNSEAMCADVRAGHLKVFADDGTHPFLSSPSYIDGLTYNDLFRAVHDLFGHAAEGYQFGPCGEHNAWLHHSMMFSRYAQRALTTETRGQNSWVNYGPHAHLPVRERPYAQQKVAILPESLCAWRWFLASENV